MSSNKLYQCPYEKAVTCDLSLPCLGCETWAEYGVKLMINYVKGDATKPIIKPAIIAHVCNNIGAWGAGFVLAISNKWPIVKEKYLLWHKQKINFSLGNVQFISVNEDITIANMIAQDGIRTRTNQHPIQYSYIKECLKRVYDTAIKDNRTVHMPRIGCGLAGGSWDKVEPIILEQLVNRGIDVYVYDLR